MIEKFSPSSFWSVKDILFLVYRMEPALSSTSFEFPHFFPGSLQAKTAGISKLDDDDKAVSIL